MQLEVTYVILAVVGTILTIFWLYLYIKGKNKYDAYIEVLGSKEYYLKDIYFIGYELIQFFGIEFRDKYSKTREKKMSQVKGEKFAQFYIFANLAGELTFLLTFSAIGFLFAVIVRIPIYAFGGVLLGTLMVLYVENVLSNKVSQRNREMMVEYPHVLSQMALLINAGMTLRETIEVISYKSNGPLTREFQVMLKDINNGLSDTEALQALANRCEIAEVRKLTSTILQNLQKGGNQLAKSLIEMSNEVWKARISSARETAEKASSKLLLPIMIIFAGILLMVIVPMFMNMM